MKRTIPPDQGSQGGPSKILRSESSRFSSAEAGIQPYPENFSDFVEGIGSNLFGMFDSSMKAASKTFHFLLPKVEENSGQINPSDNLVSLSNRSRTALRPLEQNILHSEQIDNALKMRCPSKWCEKGDSSVKQVTTRSSSRLKEGESIDLMKLESMRNVKVRTTDTEC